MKITSDSAISVREQSNPAGKPADPITIVTAMSQTESLSIKRTGQGSQRDQGTYQC